MEGDQTWRTSKGRITYISIHALRVEGDVRGYYEMRRNIYFYPRPPGGGRPRISCVVTALFLFLSTPSGWRATVAQRAFALIKFISIHALRVEGDNMSYAEFKASTISIHALRVEGDIVNSLA